MTPEEVRDIAKQAYIYAFPVVDSYRIQHAYWIDRSHPEYKGSFNKFWNSARLYSPDDRTIQSPNSDTLYSLMGADLRAEPLVITVPPIEKDRYLSLQLIDAYTFNFGYAGSRTTGNNGGTFLLAGPNWKGQTPKGIDAVFRSETDLAFTQYRTQLFGPGDLENVRKIQAAYKVQPLSSYVGRPAPNPPPPINFIQPLTPAVQRTSPEVFNVLNFVMQFAPTHSSERDLMVRFSKIGIGAGRTIDFSKLSPELKVAYEQGIADAWSDLEALKIEKLDTGEVTSGDVFGSREHLKNKYLYRMLGAAMGIYGNSKEEAMYPGYTVDDSGQKLDGTNKYILRFPPGQLPPANAFWSLTMYELPESLLGANPINRYLINSPMLPQLLKDPDGGITLYIQSESPGKDKEPNWLPAPKGPFWAAMRLYWPKQAALDGTWKQPPISKVN